MKHVSICILTFNRPQKLETLLQSLDELSYAEMEIIVADNSSNDEAQDLIMSGFPHVIYLRQQQNLGAVGRNAAIAIASSPIVITLDDDIAGISDESIRIIINTFESREEVGAVCFKVVDPETRSVINWCHHRPVEHAADKLFFTNEISEGAVAFRKAALEQSGLYPSAFFISHEGADLAIRLMNKGYSVLYHPAIVVEHYHSEQSRVPWRRYYYDTRNVIWLGARNYPLFYGLKHCGMQLTAMLAYALRDGYFRYWVRAVMDALKGLKEVLQEREVMASRTRERFREIDRNRPGLFRKTVRI